MPRNRLAAETSPYLLQHADNPVQWWAWGPDALAEAKTTGKPILLSVGYSACHWCHVMAHESFEDPGIAGLMNQLFVNIKVDREERPDLDAVYQNALAMMGQSGGWPLTMFLTPECEPFWGGTYFPPTQRWGRAAFPDVLEGVERTFRQSPDKIRQNVEGLRQGLARLGRSPGGMELQPETVEAGALDIIDLIDPVRGGTNGAPKFPQPGLFRLLWTAHERTGDKRLAQAVTVTLDHICQGGIYDHLGGGFMRYSTDEDWLVPHFEKMLYDNAQLVSLLSRVWRRTGSELYRQRVIETVGWLLRDMIAEDGAFAAALDADSEGHEGKFYTWSLEDIRALLDEPIAVAFARLYDVAPGGNWEGRSILHRNHEGGTGDDLPMAEAKAILLAHRSGRVWPGRDDKVLADWNGMMIAALAEAATTFDRPDWLAAAQRAFQVVVDLMSRPGGRLAHCARLGRAVPAGVLDDYAHMALAALALFDATGDDALVEHARVWLDSAHRHHWDDQGGGYFLSADDTTDVIVRTKPCFDNAVPAGNGAMAEAMVRLWLVTGDDVWRDRAAATIASFSAGLADNFPNMTSLLDAFLILEDPLQVVVAGRRGDGDTQSLLDVLATVPVAIHSLLVTDDDIRPPPSHPAHGKTRQNGKACAYVCRGKVCSAPIVDAGQLRALLSGR